MCKSYPEIYRESIIPPNHTPLLLPFLATLKNTDPYVVSVTQNHMLAKLPRHVLAWQDLLRTHQATYGHEHVEA